MGEIVKKPWGSYEDIFRSKFCVFKKIIIKPGQSISYQAHDKRVEFWVVESGFGEWWTSSNKQPLTDYRITKIGPQNLLLIPIGMAHRVANLGDVDLVLWETQCGECDENDIVRFDDRYGRPTATENKNPNIE